MEGLQVLDIMLALQHFPLQNVCALNDMIMLVDLLFQLLQAVVRQLGSRQNT